MIPQIVIRIERMGVLVPWIMMDQQNINKSRQNNSFTLVLNQY
jgi:hypothetical protein